MEVALPLYVIQNPCPQQCGGFDAVALTYLFVALFRVEF